MHLKALEMRGFKSFPDKTRLDFEQGITAIVGPNGSGKSNISDAVRWVLGEMSPKSLRGQKMEDVIFSGTAKRAQTGFCEVSLIMDNRDHSLSCDTDEVRITRKYFRSGDSEYRINDKTSRLKDIYELFLNTGIGREGYSVIGQGKIGEVISQKSDERRHIFEEAAGISKFRYRKNDAEKKLAETTVNLTRLSDIVREVEGRLGPLEKASENAKKYLVLADRKKELEVALWVDRVAKAASEAESYEARTESARTGYEQKSAELTENEEKSERLSNEKQQSALNAEEKRQAIASLENEKNEIAAKCALSENDKIHYHDRMTAILAETKVINEGEIASLEKELAEKKAQNETAQKNLDEALNEETIRSDALQKANDAVAEKNAALSEVEAEIRRNDEALVNNRINSTAAESDEKSAAERRGFIESEIDRTNEEIKTVTGYLEAAKERRRAATEEKDDLEASFAEEQKNYQEADAKHEELLARKNDIAAKYAAAVQRKETLEHMDKLLEGFPGSVKAVMNSSVQGLCGPVSRLLTVSGEYVTAIETALGAAFANIVVENEASAKSAIRYLKEHGAGRATFLPLDSIRPNVMNEPGIEREPGFIGIGSTLVNCEKKYAIVADYLLGRTVVADEIDHASSLARKYRFRYRVVTLDGQVINAGGSYTGGSVQAKAGALSRSADIEALDEQIRAYIAEARTITEQLKEIRESRDEAKQFCEALQNDLSSCAGEFHKADADVALHTEHLEALKARLKNAGEQLGGGTDTEDGRMDKLEAERVTLEQKRDNLASEKEACLTALETAEEAADGEEKALGELRLKLVSLRKDAENTLSLINGIEKRLEDARGRVAALEEEYTLLDSRLSDLAEALEHGAEKTAALEEKIAEETSLFDEAIAHTTALEKEINDLRRAGGDIMRDKEVFFKELTKCESALEERRKEYDTLTAKLWEEYELTYTDACALGYPAPDSASITELSSVRAKIRALGVVNVGAVEEYRETKERYEFMTAQIADLEESGKSLENVIKRLEADMRRLFSDAIVKINEQFKTVFVELFGGGSASIVITDEENLLESGIEINVQPPGKMVKSISLLSGGEQAFTAIALYFAILNVNPAPFYIFDEIEAALDDVNVYRFGDYLRRHSRETQFIVITHRRGSMEAADRLYGVTMQEKGVSSFLKVDVDEVEKKTGLKL